MSRKKTVVFFRNDDVRDKLDESLIRLTEVCMKHGVSISHAVEPANVSEEVVDWLISQKKQFPGLVEIIQHGYDHNLANPGQKMEFGGNRSFDDQYKDLKKGKETMDRLFGDLWSPIFTFPYGTYNLSTLKAIDQLGYHTISSKMQFSIKVRLKNFVGKLLGKDILFGKKINYHPGPRKGYKFREISVSANLIKRYTGEAEADHYTLEEIRRQVKRAMNYTGIIGILFHHRFHANHIELTEELIIYLKKKGVRFSTISNIKR
ncbi:MAG: DUF2334 domain-containing protein [Bacteroidota bacterium]